MHEQERSPLVQLPLLAVLGREGGHICSISWTCSWCAPGAGGHQWRLNGAAVHCSCQLPALALSVRCLARVGSESCPGEEAGCQAAGLISYWAPRVLLGWLMVSSFGVLCLVLQWSLFLYKSLPVAQPGSALLG